MMFVLVPEIDDFCTPSSVGLKMFYRATPFYKRVPGLTIPACSHSTRQYGPFEHRPDGEYEAFTLHRAPLEELISRWRTGDIRQMVREVGTPSAGLSFGEASAWVASRSPSQRKVLDDFRAEIAEERRLGIELQVHAHLQYYRDEALFSTLLYGAVQTLDWEVRQFADAWWEVEQQVARGPSRTWATLGALFAGIVSAVDSLLGAPPCAKSSLAGPALPSLLTSGTKLKSYASTATSTYVVDGCFASGCVGTRAGLLGGLSSF